MRSAGPSRSRRAPRALRGGFQLHAVATLLVGALAVVALLTLRAHYAISSHRVMAEGVLRDYAALVGDEALRRIAVQVGAYGYRDALSALRRAVGPDPEVPPAPETLDRDTERSGRSSLELVHRTFLYRPSAEPLRVSTSRPEVDAWLGPALGALELGPSSDFETLHAEVAGVPHTVVVGWLDPASSERVLIGFEVDRAAVSRWCAEALAGPLLPPTLAGGELDNRALDLRVLDSAGNELFAQGEPGDAPLSVDRGFPEGYRLALDGVRVIAGIRPEAASRLVIGGLPRSDLPALLTMLALVVGLLAAAVVLLRRERELARLRSDFVSRVSHELRTPLAQIRMFTETLLLGRVRNEEERRRSLEIMDRESRRLSTLVENILQFSRAERGHVQLAPRLLTVAVLLRRLAVELEILAQTQGAALVVEAPDRLAVVADEDALRQIVINLVDNAIKYGPRGQRVTLGAAARDGLVRLWVEDEGPGVPAADRERVWQPYSRAEPAGRAVAGTGIGLAVVRELVHQHGGRCWLEAGVTRGARVVVELPAVEEVVA